MSTPHSVIVLVISRSQALAPHHVVGSVDVSVIIEITEQARFGDDGDEGFGVAVARAGRGPGPNRNQLDLGLLDRAESAGPVMGV
jgi:hypothetical protein